MTIRKGSFTFSFMFDDTIDPVDDVMQMSIERILSETDIGHMLGHVSVPLAIVEVPNEKVAEEEIAMGCDGTFFADPDELEDSRERPDRPCDPTCSRRFSLAAECDCSRSL